MVRSWVAPHERHAAVKLTLENLRTFYDAANEHEAHWIADVLSWDDPRAFHRARAMGRRFQSGDGKVSLVDTRNACFPSGYLRAVLEAAPKDSIPVSVVDNRARPSFAPGPPAAWLRDYQREAVDAVLKRTRGLLHMPTGSGKTECFAALTLEVPARWLFVVHRTTLALQAAERVQLRTGEACGIIADGSVDTSKRVTVASFQALHAGMKRRSPQAIAFLASIEGLCVDEAHTLAADTFFGVAMETTNAYFRIGLSGTPLARGDKRSIVTIGALGPVIYRLPAERLIKAGVLAKPIVTMRAVLAQSSKETAQGVYAEAIVRNVKRNKVIVREAQRVEKPALVFVKQISHARDLTKRLEKAGLKVRSVMGADSTEERQAAAKDLVRGDLDVVVCSVVWQEGLDIPELRSVVVAAGGASVIAAIQRVGRGMRRSEGKDSFEVVDFDDLGHPWPARHSRARRRSYVAEGYEITEPPKKQGEDDTFPFPADGGDAMKWAATDD